MFVYLLFCLVCLFVFNLYYDFATVTRLRLENPLESCQPNIRTVSLFHSFKLEYIKLKKKMVVPKGIEWMEYWAKGISSMNMEMAHFICDCYESLVSVPILILRFKIQTKLARSFHSLILKLMPFPWKKPKPFNF